MAGITRKQYVWVAGVALIAVMVGAIFLLSGFGSAYREGLAGFTQSKKSEDVSLKKTRKINRLTLKRQEDPGCTEIAPDGTVRVYTTCGQTLETAQRALDPKYILTLIRKVAELKWQDFEKPPPTGSFIAITVETDEGSQVLYVPTGGADDQTEEIITVIEKIEEDVPQSTPTPTLIVPSSTPLPGTTSTPTPLVSPTPLPPTLTPGPTSGFQQAFTCGFSEGNKKKPYTISNIICSTEPSPAP